MKKSINFISAIALLFCVGSCDSLHEDAVDLNRPIYFAEVKAIFNANSYQCSSCHDGTSTGGKIKNSAGKQVNTDNYEDVKLWVNFPDKADFQKTYLYLSINPLVKGSVADMTKGASNLSKDQIAIINKWLADGAPEK